MTRKMLKEERKLRNIIRDLDTGHSCCPTCGTETERHRKKCRWGAISPAITDLVRAVREDCAFRVRCASAGESIIEVGVATHAIIHHWGYRKEDDPQYQAAAIRRKK